MLIKSKTPHKANIIAIINLWCTQNNTIINASYTNYKTILCNSTGALGIKGSRRSTYYAGQSISNISGKALKLLGVKYIYVKIKGFGKGRYSGIKGLLNTNLKFLSILDVTPTPFNGCKTSKKRRA
uniref:ribosomal protein S11 n=1 Tax=Cryptomonas gyropyrenoidosa TaxID=233257 RepID=UPI00279816F6|nr:ribosomal protein S11 [Cryptomonas gyropyrenoidosa]WFQ82697.1 ribosomal protein S11 [Cryptomonas gyropyrenoidosa]